MTLVDLPPPPAATRVLVTAASGAVARLVIERLVAQGIAVTAAARGAAKGLPPGTRAVVTGAIDGDTDWSAALVDATHVVHLAALTRLEAGQDEHAYTAVNTDGTRALADQAAAAGVRRFVQISTAAVNGRLSGPTPIRPDDPPAPANAYAQSKLAAEEALQAIASRTGLEIAIVRPPRIVWPALTGNLRLFERLIARGVPLPLGGVRRNARDNVSPPNLVEVILACLLRPGAGGGMFFATDGDPLSTRALAERIAHRAGHQARLLPVPPAVLRAIIAVMPARLLGQLSRQEMADELLGDFRLDIAPTCDRLGWRPEPGTL